MSVPSLHQSDVNAAIVQRIAGLEADAQPRWGKMDCAQMLFHCRKPFEVAFGETQLKRGIIGLLFGGMGKRKFIDADDAFHQNSPTMPQFLNKNAKPEEVAGHKEALIAQVKRFGEGAAVIAVHPFFGKLTPEEWNRLLWKHLDHHLRQFGQ